MNLKKPQFELARVLDDGNQESVEIVQITQLPWETRTERRGFLGTGIGASLLLTMLNAYGANAPTVEKSASSSASDISKTIPDCAEGRAHIEAVNTLAMSHDGKLLVTGSEDYSIKLWNLPDGALLKSLAGHKGKIRSLAISPDGKLLASGSAAGYDTINLWALPEGTFLKTLDSNVICTSLAISQDGRLLVSADNVRGTKLWSLPEGHLIKKLNASYNVAINSGGRQMISTHWSDREGVAWGRIELWRLPDGGLIKSTYSGQKGGVSSLDITSDGKLLATASVDGTIKLWSLPAVEPLKTLNGHTGSISTLAIAPDGKLMASGSEDGTIMLWSLPEGDLFKTLYAHTGEVKTLAISPDGRLLVSGGVDKTVKLWSFPDGHFKTCLIDLKSSPSSAIGNTYTMLDSNGQSVTYTLPCGSPIPLGAICTCNCVPGSYSAPTYSTPATTSPAYNSGRTYCSCNKVCTCVPVYGPHR